MTSTVIYGLASLSAVIVSVRLYNIFFKWGSYKDMLQKKADSTQILRNQTVIITGGNCGIGKQTARELYRHGARVILANRTEKESSEIIRDLRQSCPDATGQLAYRFLDLSSLESVKTFASSILHSEPHVDILINNAAVYGVPITITQDGFEVNMQINHLAPALLVMLLLPKLSESYPRKNKIITVTSSHYKHGVIHERLLEKMDPIDLIELQNLRLSASSIYSSTKLTNLIFMRQIINEGKMAENIQICFATPGFAFTRLHRYVPKPTRIAMALFFPLLAMVLKTSKEGAQTIIGCALAKSVSSDVIYQNCKPNESHFRSGITADYKTGERLFDLTTKALKDYL